MDNAKILIVEDERIPAEYLKAILEQAGYNVVGICDRGAQAIEVTRDVKPDLILMDIILKDNISGSEAALKISTFSDVKIIFLTAYSDREMVDYALESGAVNYLIKPYREEQILTAIELAMGRHHTERRSDMDTSKRINLCDDYSYDRRTRQLYQYDREIWLPVKKRKLLEILCRRMGETVNSKTIANEIYGADDSTSALRTLVSRFNKMIGWNMIENVSKIGYKMCSPKES